MCIYLVGQPNIKKMLACAYLKGSQTPNEWMISGAVYRVSETLEHPKRSVAGALDYAPRQPNFVYVFG